MPSTPDPPRGPIRHPVSDDALSRYLCQDGRLCTEDPSEPTSVCECYAAVKACNDRAADLLLERRLLRLAGVDVQPPEGDPSP